MRNFRQHRRRVLRAGGLLLLTGTLILGLFLLGCFSGPRRPTTLPAVGPDAPHLIHVVGWNGPVAGDRAFLDSLRAGGSPHAMETFDWTDGHNGIRALRYAQRSPSPARRLATRISELAAAGTTIDLTADSSGCGVVLSALAQLPTGVRVRTVVMSSPAVSTGYDLRAALHHVDGQLVAFHSRRDWFILGLGTWIFGTVDGVHASSAGRYGFRRADPKLVQLPYDAAWKKQYGHDGLHARTLEPAFARDYLAPRLAETVQW